MAIKVDKRFLDDIIAVEDREMYPSLVGRITDTLSSHRGVLDTDTGTPEKEEEIEILLVGMVGSATKAVGLRRVRGGFYVVCKEDNLGAIEKMKDRTTDVVLDVGTNTIIATLSKRRNARIGEKLAPNYCTIVEELLA